MLLQKANQMKIKTSCSIVEQAYGVDVHKGAESDGH